MRRSPRTWAVNARQTSWARFQLTSLQWESVALRTNEVTLSLLTGRCSLEAGAPGTKLTPSTSHRCQQTPNQRVLLPWTQSFNAAMLLVDSPDHFWIRYRPREFVDNSISKFSHDWRQNIRDRTKSLCLQKLPNASVFYTSPPLLRPLQKLPLVTVLIRFQLQCALRKFDSIIRTDFELLRRYRGDNSPDSAMNFQSLVSLLL